MAAPSANTPAICGVAQVIQRPGSVDLAEARGPIELMVDAARSAAADAGRVRLLDRVDLIAVVGGVWRHSNPGQLIAEQIGSPDAATALTGMSGSAPQDLVGIVAERIARGEIEVALIVGGEARWSQQRLSRAALEPTWQRDPGTGEPEKLAPLPVEMMAEMEMFSTTAAAYALFDDSMRFELGNTMSEHRDLISGLWSRFSGVAAANPFAWDQVAHSAPEIRDASPINRMIAFPYTKAEVANNTVDMASAIILCSTAAARAAGVSPDRLVFPHVVAYGHETWHVVNRDVLHHSSALAAAGAAAFSHAHVGPADIEHVDLYACFPSIVRMSAAALGLDRSRQLTVTGGLGFAGAPLANAVGQSLAAIVPLVRGGGFGLVHGNGGLATKQTIGIYSNQPPGAFARIDVQRSADLQTRTAIDPSWSGAVQVEAATVIFDRDGPKHALAAVLTDSGERGWATSQDTVVMDLAMEAGLAGMSARRLSDGRLAI